MTEQRKEERPWWEVVFDDRFIVPTSQVNYYGWGLKVPSPNDIKAFICTLERETIRRAAERVRSEGSCRSCNGSGQEIVGENRVTRDMAIDAGEPSMEGSHHSFVYDRCSECYGTGIDPVCEDIAKSLEANETKG